MTLITYDICDPKRLRKVARLLEKHGLRAQYSAFEFDLTAKEIDRIVDEVETIIDPDSDCVYVYTISEKKKKTRRRGKKKSIWEIVF